MENTENPKKKKWKRGVDMPEFSGRSWRELNDIWPQDVRVSSEIWKALSVLPVAMAANKEFQKTLLGRSIMSTDLFQLMWVMRCEEAREDVGTHFGVMKVGKNINAKILSLKNATLVKLGLIEQFPARQTYRMRLYRVTHLGRIILKNLVEEMDKAHQNVKVWVNGQPEPAKKLMEKYLNRFCFNVDEDNVTSS